MVKLSKLLATISFFVAGTAFSQQTVQIVWPFGPTSASNYVRHIINRANTEQKKYSFILQDRPGGGGSIAANIVKKESENKNLALLATSTTFFIRPFIYSKPGYSLDEFTLIVPLAEVPFALVTRTDMSLDQLLKKPNATMGTVQVGTTFHLLSEGFKRADKPDLNIVPYNSQADYTKDIIGGTIDSGLLFISEAKANPKLQIQGVTSRLPVSGVRPLRDFGIKAFDDFNLQFLILAPTSMNKETWQELHNILIKAMANNEELQNSLKFDNSLLINVDAKDYNAWYKNRIDITKKFTATIKIIE